MIWRFLKDLLLSGAIAFAVLTIGFMGSMHARSRLRLPHPHRPYRVRALESTKAIMDFLMVPVEHPRRLVPQVVRRTPVIGRPIVSAVTILTFSPCLWTLVAFMGIKFGRWIDKIPHPGNRKERQAASDNCSSQQ